MPPRSDFAEMLSALADAGAEYVIVGGYAVGFHGHPRYTRDLDLFVRPTPANARKVWRALAAFGAPLEGVDPEYLATPENFLQVGVPPVRIDFLTTLGPVSFADAMAHSVLAQFDGVAARYIGVDDLLTSKIAAGRPQDRQDVKKLRKLHPNGGDL